MGLRYLLDTNIVSELARRHPDPAAERRVGRLQDACALAAPTVEELVFGVDRLRDGERKRMLELWLEGVLSSFPVLPYDARAALWLGQERARLASMGQAVSRADGEIAAVAVAGDLILVTRNESDFRLFTSLRLRNWFSAS